MDQSALLKRCQQLAGFPHQPNVDPNAYAEPNLAETNLAGQSAPHSTPTSWTPEDAIGFFQTFRPDGENLEQVFRDVPHGEELLERILEVFEMAGDPTRPDGARDAYFVVRKPTKISEEVARFAATEWLKQMAELDRRVGSQNLAQLLDAAPSIRVLEGQPPKHPRQIEERSDLLKLISSFSQRVVSQLNPEQDAALALRRAYYFMACDTFLSEYLLWPVYRSLTGLEDPFEPYFTLWKAGIKFRIFNDRGIDFYMPRKV